MKKRFISMLLLTAISLLSISTITISAETEQNLSTEYPQEYKELVALAKDADNFVLFTLGHSLEWIYVVKEVDRLENAGEHLEFWNIGIQPFVEKGYIGEQLTIDPSFDYNTDFFLYFDLPDAMQTMQAWEEAVGEYFTGDHWGILQRIVKRNGRYMILADRGGHYLAADWENAKLVEYSESHAVLTVDDVNAGPYFPEERDMTFVFVKTEAGWRIDESTYMTKRCEEMIDPPKAGDSTAAYALIFTLAALPLAGFGVYEWKKRRRAI